MAHVLYVKEENKEKKNEAQSIISDALKIATDELEKARRKLEILKEQARLYVLDTEEAISEKLASALETAKSELEKAKLKIEQLKIREKGQKKKKTQSWANQMKPLFDAINFIGKYKIYRPTKYFSRRIGNGLGQFFGKVVLGSSGATQYKIKSSLKALYPKLKKNPKKLQKYVNASLKYYGALLLDFMWNLPATTDRPLHTFFSYKNLEVLDRALDKGRGVILVTTHIGEFLHIIPAFTQFHTKVDKKKALNGYEPKEYVLASVAQLNNLPMYINNNKKHMNRLYIYPSVSFSKISKYLENHLKKNHILVMYHDYSTPKQLRAPFIDGKMNFLINTPQSYISLHKKTNAVILPVIAHPNEIIGKTQFEFLEEDSNRIMETSEKYWNSSKKIFHGRLSTEINKRIYPFVRKYAHVWEEIMNFAVMRTSMKLRFEPNISIADFIKEIKEKITGEMGIIDNSFEPDRDDEKIIGLIDSNFEQILKSLKNPEIHLRDHKTKITLSQLDSIGEIRKLMLIIRKELKSNKETEAIDYINLILHEL